LSVKNYLHIVDHIKGMIAAAGKKHYTFVVGKINAAKLANFSEVGGWVVVGCWESSLVESAEFYKPVITPFELQLTLQADKERIWTGQWTSDFEAVLKEKETAKEVIAANSTDLPAELEGNNDLPDDSEEESAPPEFDLRTGRYVSHSRPMRTAAPKEVNGSQAESAATGQLIKRAIGTVAQIGGVASPGAEYLRSNRTWQGLGSDFEVDYTHSGADGALMEQGRSGIARGYTAGEEEERR
jgi:diphthamide biosynthesis protein 2